ncbi:MAG TPA: class II fructose-bisphosphatase [Patescibacteria group bacterium]|nr:class II fructose-bisphosphatase [Patescibacteria group bacterium]
MDRNLALEFVRVTEAAAIAASAWIGKGDKKNADQAAVDAMRLRLNRIDFSGVIVIGEGEKDEAPMLFTGEHVGKKTTPKLDLAVDPLEATDSVALGRYNALSVIVTGPQGSLLSAPDMYMEKLAVGPKAKKAIDLNASVKDNISCVAKALEKDIHDLTIILLERERHEKLIEEIRLTGARVRLITDGDVAGAIAPCLPSSGIDMLMGIGASTEAVLASAAIKAFGGEILARFVPQNTHQEKALKEMKINHTTIFSTDTLTKGTDLTFTATGVIDGPLLFGVKEENGYTITHSLVIRAHSKTLRYMTTHHLL